MRVGEAIRLDRDDFDVVDGVAASSGTPSSASPARSRCTRAPSTRSPPTATTTRPACRPPAPRRSSSPPPAPGCSTATCTGLFRRLVRRAGLQPRSPRVGPALTTCATASPCTPCSAGTATAPMRRRRLPLLSTYLGHVDPGSHLLVSVRRPRAARPRRRTPRTPPRSDVMTCARPRPCRRSSPTGSIRQRHASPHTVAAYRDTFRLLLGFAADHAPASHPATSTSTTSTPTLIGAFLDHLEHDRHNSVRTRNTRLAAIHSLFGYAALRHPEHAAMIEPGARHPAETPRPGDSSPSSPPPKSTRSSPPPTATTWLGRRDHALLALAVQTGYASPSSPGSPAVTFISAPAPTSAATAKDARNASPRSPPEPSPCCAHWLTERRGQPARPAVPHPDRPTTQPRRRRAPPRQSRRRRRHDCPSLHDKTVTAHVLRHTAAMRLLARRRRHHRHRPLARPRTRRDHRRSTSTPTSPSRNEPSPGPPHADATPGRYQPTDTTPRLPRSPLIMPTSSAPNPSTRHSHADIGIIRTSA